jgi:menaquinone-dependent protoporphyrinogen oxidase
MADGQGGAIVMKVLVAYASRHGATKGIAERLATTLTEEGLDVTLRQVEEVITVEAYDAYVIGSAAYMGRWLGAATEFIRSHRSVFAEKPVWLFSSGPIGTELVDKEGRDVLDASRPREFVEFEISLKPRGEQVFFGAFDPDAPPVGMAERIGSGFFKLIPAARAAMPAGDFRDWPAIESWAREIAVALKEPVPA